MSIGNTNHSVQIIKGPSDDLKGVTTLHTPPTSLPSTKFTVHLPRPKTMFRPPLACPKARMLPLSEAWNP